jgi:D-alanine-D-alanine ligase-like ATP-grasp enzyme
MAVATRRADKSKTAVHRKLHLPVDKSALKKLRLVAVAYSFVEREFFATEEAYVAEQDVEQRAQLAVDTLAKLGIPAKGYPANQYFLPSLLVDRPDLVVNLVDTLKGSDLLQTSIPAALELADIPYTGCGMQGLVIGNDRHLTKQLMVASGIPTPEFQFIRRAGTKVKEDLGLPLIVKLNESGGSVGIDDHAVKETVEDAQQRVDELISTYKRVYRQ